jgi:hypothetical protein
VCGRTLCVQKWVNVCPQNSQSKRVPVHAMKKYTGTSLYSLIHNRGSRWRWKVNFTKGLLYFRGKNTVSLDRGEWNGPRTMLHVFLRSEKFLVPVGNRTPGSPGISLVTVSTTLSRFVQNPAHLSCHVFEILFFQRLNHVCCIFHVYLFHVFNCNNISIKGYKL